jgi:RimJ/RimL family protein N-acetyltransferase
VSRHWPLHALRITSPTLELRVPDEAIIDDLVDLAAQGIHDPDVMPFVVPWTDIEPPRFQQSAVTYHWRVQASVMPAAWVINFAVFRRGTLVGTQGIDTVEFATRGCSRPARGLAARIRGRGSARRCAGPS